ncbi:hypothetical protein H2200_012457 [Cladophialophora chaetospira]|uniref:Enoyl reductase (ER) domain-containing protein n=1 Tax=Cladophialophora chaetospira TaxID=386627 RepID=A0AA38WXY8_9EURO|nr:hypothetical protein H2200_012457 [Cladophialophora chaetospira]
MAMEESSQTTPLLRMRAWTHEIQGPPETVLSFRDNIPRPRLDSSTPRVLVRVKYAALNPGGSIMMQLCPSFLKTKPSIPEMDFAGHIVEIGSGVDQSLELEPQLEVFGSIPVSEHLKGHGALGEYVDIDAHHVCKAPNAISLQEAAGLPIAGCTALCLLDQAKLRQGQTILVNGAAGGIGSLVTQMVRHAIGDQGRLVAVCSREKGELVRELGADEVIDRRSPEPVHQLLAEKYSVSKFDVIIDAYGVQSLYESCTSFLKENGSYVTVGVAFNEYTYGSMLVAVTRMLKNILWPRLLGGAPRK